MLGPLRRKKLAFTSQKLLEPRCTLVILGWSLADLATYSDSSQLSICLAKWNRRNLGYASAST